MIKAVFFDVDGTLVSHNTHSVPQSAKEAVVELRKKGIKIFLATGRHIHELKEMPTREIKFDGYIILNGQICLDENKNLIFSNSFKTEEINGLLDIFEKKEYPLVLVNKDGHYMNFVNDVVEIALQSVSTPIPPIKSYNGEELYQATVFISSTEDEMFEQKLPRGCKLARWGEHGADIIIREGGKSIGMNYFSKIFNILPEEMMAFGDAQNDIDMLQYAGIGIAMGNAKESLKQIADDVTNDVEEDGVRNALYKYGVL